MENARSTGWVSNGHAKPDARTPQAKLMLLSLPCPSWHQGGGLKPCRGWVRQTAVPGSHMGAKGCSPGGAGCQIGAKGCSRPQLTQACSNKWKREWNTGQEAPGCHQRPPEHRAGSSQAPSQAVTPQGRAPALQPEPRQESGREAKLSRGNPRKL